MKIVSRIGGFFIEIVRSGYDMEFYRTVRTRPLRSAFAYAAGFHLIMALAMLLVVGPRLFMADRRLAAEIEKRLPDGATFAVQKGEMSTTLDAPTDIGVPGFPVIIDTSATQAHAQERLDAKPGVLVARDAIVLQNDKVERRTYLLAEFPDFRVTKEDMLSWLRTWAVPVIVVGLFVFGLVYWGVILASVLIYAALAGLVALLLGRLWRVRLDYGRWYAIGLHAVTLPIILDIIFNVIGLRIPFAFTLVFFMFVAAVIADERSNPTAAGESGRPAERTPAPPRARTIAKRTPRKPRSPKAPGRTGPGPAGESPVEPPTGEAKSEE